MEYLKIGTCIGSAWVTAIGVQMYFGRQIDNVESKLMTAFAVAVGISTPYIQNLIKQPAKLFTHLLHTRQRSAAPEDLQVISDDLSKSAGFRNPLKLTFFKAGRAQDNALCLINDIYFSSGLYRKLREDGERKFILAHEITHAKERDAAIKYLSSVPYYTQYTNLALGGIAAGQILKQGVNPVTVAASAVIMAGSYLSWQFANVAQKKVSRICEYRADRGALKLTEDPISAISALAKIDMGIDHDGFYEKLKKSHPSRTERITAIIDAFNQGEEKIILNKPDETRIKILNSVTLGIDRLYIDARAHNGREYFVTPFMGMMDMTSLVEAYESEDLEWAGNLRKSRFFTDLEERFFDPEGPNPA